MKRIFISLLLILFLILPAWAGSEYGYVWKPPENKYVLKYEGKVVEIFFLDRVEFVTKRIEHFGPPTTETIAIVAFTITWVNKRTGVPSKYEVYLQRAGDGEVNLDSLGHELAHVFEHGKNWHPEREGHFK